jgi:NADH:ubiquinone oxidoreductase subunit K
MMLIPLLSYPLLSYPLQGFALPVLHSPLGLPHVLTLAAALFALGLFAALAHRSLLRILMGFSLMLLATLLNLAAFTTYLHASELHGHAFALLLVILMLAQLAIGLSVIAMLLRRAGASAPGTPAPGEPDLPQPTSDALDVDRYDDLKG